MLNLFKYISFLCSHQNVFSQIIPLTSIHAKTTDESQHRDPHIAQANLYHHEQAESKCHVEGTTLKKTEQPIFRDGYILFFTLFVACTISP